MPAYLPHRRSPLSTLSSLLALLSLSTGLLVAADAPPPPVVQPAPAPAPAPVTGQPNAPFAAGGPVQGPMRNPMPPMQGFKPPDFTLRLIELSPTGSPTDDSQKLIEDMVADNWRPLTLTTVSATDPVRVVMLFQRNPPRMPGRGPMRPMMAPQQGAPMSAGPAPQPAPPVTGPAPAPVPAPAPK